MKTALKISRLLHAGYLFECENTSILFDPIFENPFSRNCHAFPQVRFDLEAVRRLRPAAVFISHFHDDHCSFESLDLLNRETPLYVYCAYEELFLMLRELGFTRIHPLHLDTTVAVGSFSVTPRRALEEGVDSMFQVRAAGCNLLNVVDAWIDPTTLPDLAREAPWDLVLWPFQTLRETAVIAPRFAEPPAAQDRAEALEPLAILRPRCVVPSSCQFIHENWSWYNRALFPVSYRQFQAEVEALLPETQVVRLNPSVSIFLSADSGAAPAPPVDWIHPIGQQDVDYLFDPRPPPSTSEIARHLEPLAPGQAAQVREYCLKGLLARYRSLEPSTDPFFARPRCWRLSVYDSDGEAEQFHYLLSPGTVELLASAELPPLSWTTEVPASKLLAALEAGETLTSMYVRVNDAVFDPNVEAELQTVDVAEDPLIRCLFNGVFGAYQAAQLRRLKGFRSP